jgi:SSS family solute:Na+ symporter/sodium/proline symporter
VTAAGGVSSILGGMSVPVLNKILEVTDTNIGILPVNTDYIAIPSLIASLTLLIVVSLLTKKSPEAQWMPFFDKTDQ